MTGATTKIPFCAARPLDDIPLLSELQNRFTQKLREIRMELNRRKSEGLNAENFRALITAADTAKIKRRAVRYRERLRSQSGAGHLPQRDEVMLTPLRDGLPVARIMTEHEADEIAAALHEEMPWMAPATEVVWNGLKASARDGLPGLRFHPLVLVGPPGIWWKPLTWCRPSWKPPKRRLPITGWKGGR